MKIHHLAASPSILNTFISELRDKTVQKDRMRFRRNIERIGEIMAYEISKALQFKAQPLETPLGSFESRIISDDIVICCILRAGLPLHNGLITYFDKADSAFISAYRKHDAINGEDYKIEVEYLACPDLNNKVLLLVDPMLASGRSLIAAHKVLLAYGQPKKVHLVSILGSKPGVSRVTKRFPDNTELWIGDIDEQLNQSSYIVPGLGDAGDLSYGEKLQR